MKQTLLQEKYPVFSLEIERTETSKRSVDEIVDYFKEQIEAQHRHEMQIRAEKKGVKIDEDDV